MRDRLAALLTVFGLLVGLVLMGAGSAAASSGTTNPTFDCHNHLGSGQHCVNDHEVTVNVTYLGLLTGAQLVMVEDVLNAWAIVGIDGDVNWIKSGLINLYRNDFGYSILSGNVVVVGWPTCGC